MLVTKKLHVATPQPADVPAWECCKDIEHWRMLFTMHCRVEQQVTAVAGNEGRDAAASGSRDRARTKNTTKDTAAGDFYCPVI